MNNDELGSLLKAGMHRLEDDSFAEKIIHQHLAKQRQHSTLLLGKSTSVATLISLSILLCGVCILLFFSKKELVEFNLELKNEYLVILSFLSFVALIYNYLMIILVSNKLLTIEDIEGNK